MRQGILSTRDQQQLCTQNLWWMYQPYRWPCSWQLAMVDLAEGLSTSHLLLAWLTQCLQAVSSAAADKLHWCMTFTLDGNFASSAAQMKALPSLHQMIAKCTVSATAMNETANNSERCCCHRHAKAYVQKLQVPCAWLLQQRIDRSND